MSGPDTILAVTTILLGVSGILQCLTIRSMLRRIRELEDEQRGWRYQRLGLARTAAEAFKAVVEEPPS